jgi:hypothetical protein
VASRRTNMPDGEELLRFVASMLPVNLPVEIREETQAAIVLDLLTKKVKADVLKDPRIIRKYVQVAYGFQDKFRFASIDAPVGDGEGTLGDLLAA